MHTGHELVCCAHSFAGKWKTRSSKSQGSQIVAKTNTSLKNLQPSAHMFLETPPFLLLSSPAGLSSINLPFTCSSIFIPEKHLEVIYMVSPTSKSLMVAQIHHIHWGFSRSPVCLNEENCKESVFAELKPPNVWSGFYFKPVGTPGQLSAVNRDARFVPSW